MKAAPLLELACGGWQVFAHSDPALAGVGVRAATQSPGGGALMFCLLPDCLCQNRGGHDCVCCLRPRAAQVRRQGGPDQLRRCLLHRPAAGTQGTYCTAAAAALLPCLLWEGRHRFLHWCVSPPESLGLSEL